MDKINLLIGTHPDNANTGIYMYEFDQSTGDIKYIDKMFLDDFSHFTVSSDNKFIYAISQTDEGKGKISSYQLNMQSRDLNLLNEQDIDGTDPCYIIINEKRTYAIVANNGSGDIVLFKINSDGSLSEQIQKVEFQGRGGNNKSQQHSHIQCINFTPNEEHIIISDLGTDSIYIYKIIELNNSAYIQATNYIYKLNVEGSGPRSFVFHPNGKYIYLINALKSIVKFYDYSQDYGTITLSQSLKDNKLDPKGYTHIKISPEGHFLYTASRGEKTKLSFFSISQKSGLLKQLESIEINTKISHFTISPNGKYMIIAAPFENTVLIYKRSVRKGFLYPSPNRIRCDHPEFIKVI